MRRDAHAATRAPMIVPRVRMADVAHTRYAACEALWLARVRGEALLRAPRESRAPLWRAGAGVLAFDAVMRAEVFMRLFAFAYDVERDAMRAP